MNNEPDRWEFSWIEIPTYTNEATHEGLRKKLDEGWEPLQVIPMESASNWWLIFLKRRRTAQAAPAGRVNKNVAP
jgi:hypothetical protein